MASSVDGLVSGLSTSSLISQLMQVEKAPQQRLKSKVTAEQSIISAYRSVNTRLAALETAGENLASSTTWQAVKATSSSDAVSASAAAGASGGSLTFDVTNLSRAQVSTAVVNPNGDITAANTIDVTIGATTTQIDVSGDRSAQGVVEAINAAGIAVKAALVTTSGGDTVLQLSGTKTGTANSFTVANLNDPVTVAISAANAQIQVGNPLAGGYTVSSDTNAFTGLMAGTTLTVKRVEAGITVDVRSDVDAMASKIQSLVDAANGAIAEVNKQTAFDVTAKTSQPLAADGTARQLGLSISSAISNGLSAADYPTLTNRDFKQIGVELDKTGKLVFKKETFVAAGEADPTVAKTVAAGLGQNLDTLSDAAQSTVTGTIKSHETFTRNLNSQILSWDVRLANRENALIKQFANLEKALGKLKDQSNWLSGQLASLPSGN